MSKREELKALRAADRRRQNQVIMGILVFGALLIAGVLLWPSLMKEKLSKINFPSVGSAEAVVIVEEFSDFQCPYCQRFALQMEPEFMTRYVETGKVLWKFIPFSFLGEESVKAAEAAFCAEDQEKFWEYHKLIFESQNGENGGAFTKDKFMQLAVNLSLDTTVFEKCVEDATHAQKVKDSLTYGKNLGVNGTPYFMVNGRLVDSSELSAAIDSALAEK